jgi:hypothetical protein
MSEAMPESYRFHLLCVVPFHFHIGTISESSTEVKLKTNENFMTSNTYVKWEWERVVVQLAIMHFPFIIHSQK